MGKSKSKSKPVYTIKPLEWQEKIEPEHESYFATVPMGSYTVQRYREDFDVVKPWGNWRWEYCFDEYYDEHGEECDDADHGKQLAWENWLSRITPALEEVRSRQQ